MARRSDPFSTSRPFSLGGVRWGEVDWHILATALALLGVGLIFLSAMGGGGAALSPKDIDFGGHLKKLAVSLPAIAFGFLLRPRWLRSQAWLIYSACIGLLLLVPIIGLERNNARRWIETPAFDLQPSELAKVAVIVMLGRVLHRNRLARGRDWIAPLVVALLPMGLVALQPDLGTALTMVPVTLGMLYLAGARASIIGRFVLGVGLLGFLSFQLGWVHGYQAERIDTWLESYEADNLIEARRGGAFHLYQARVAMGNGGVLGTGLGRGIANETGYLPERESDSIFAVMAEESGFLGAIALLSVYTLLVLLMMGRASTMRDRFSRLVVGGISIYFASHMFINVSVNLGILPMTGLTLPLFSTGGSSLLASFTALGLALGLASHQEPLLDGDSFSDY